MTTFKLDTTGKIACPGTPCLCHAATWDQLSPFTQGYIEALFASVVEGETVLHGDLSALDNIDAWAFSDIAPETLARIIEDCAWLCTDAKGRAASAETGREAWAVRQAGNMAHAAPLVVQLVDGKVRFQEAA